MSQDIIRLGHGGGGQLTTALVKRVFLARWGNPALQALGDAANLDLGSGKLAFTTDGYVVTPWQFAGGDIGRLAVCGTVNDLAMRGAQPLYMSAGFILEEGLPLGDLERIVVSMAHTVAEVGAQIVTGDTKVVNRGSADRVFINTTGIGLIPPDVHLSAAGVQVGDTILVSGTLGDRRMDEIICDTINLDVMIDLILMVRIVAKRIKNPG